MRLTSDAGDTRRRSPRDASSEVLADVCGDPFCPCQDGDPCNYDDGALPFPSRAEIRRRREVQDRLVATGRP